MVHVYMMVLNKRVTVNEIKYIYFCGEYVAPGGCMLNEAGNKQRYQILG